VLTFLKHRRLVLVLLVASTLVAALAAKINTAGNLTVAAATTNMMVDDPNASIVDRLALWGDVTTLQKHAVLYGRLMTTTPVLAAIAKRAGLAADELSGISRITEGEPHSLLQIAAEERANRIRVSRAPYRLELQASPVEPILTIYAEAPSFPAALRLANSSILGLRDYLRTLARQQHWPLRDLPQLRQLGNARGGISHSSAKLMIAALTFITAFALSFVGLLVIIKRPWRRREEDRLEEVFASPRESRRISARAAADWPRTTRLLPWSIAALIAMIWLTPFDRIQLTASGPINITLDRILLPVIVVIWFMARAAGAAAKPRVKITRVHVAFAVFIACALLSVVLDARYLNQTGDFMLSIKKLPLLVTYVSIFLIVASSVRKTEVRAFMNYTLVLAVLCGIEVIYEYHFKENLFLIWGQRLIHSPFELVSGSGPALDSLGRSWVDGPTGYGVELVAMMAMVLPIPILGILGTKSRGRQLLYSLAIVVLVSAIFATQRKSALVLPVGVILVLAYFRRRELIALAPLGMVLLVMVALVSPGVIHGVISQFTAPGSTHVATVSDRTADYDAVRPDVWSHLIFGRGYGSYDPLTYRVLDSEILGPLVETGVFGLAAYLMIAVSLMLFSRKPAASRNPRLSTPGLVGVGAGITMLIASILYDFLGFPHGAFTFLYFAGLVAAAIRPGAYGLAPARVPRGHAFRGHSRPQRQVRDPSAPSARAELARRSP
jgi:uncharacterized membrane protein